MSTNSQQKQELMIALTGQQNAGKSTLFNALTGLQQHIANYPGVTVDKKSGFFRLDQTRVEVVDLPGTYGLTTFSPEERVTRDFILKSKPDLIVNVVDAANLERSLYLTFQLMDLGLPMLLVLNMMDMVEHLGLEVNPEKLEQKLGIPVIATPRNKEDAAKLLHQKIVECAHAGEAPKVWEYELFAPQIQEVSQSLEENEWLSNYPRRWAALKLLEDDEVLLRELQQECLPEYQAKCTSCWTCWATLTRTRDYCEKNNINVSDYFTITRSQWAKETCDVAMKVKEAGKTSFTERIDRWLLNRFLAPVFLLLTIWLIYQLSIVQGYELTKVTWPLLAGMRQFISTLLPEAGFLADPHVRSIGLWMVDSANTLLNYVPIFLILFALIAILEDSGYMARIAFILDRILHRFGLHGQSTLPLILAGVFAGGCAVPGVMATKGIPDTRARMATILTVPFMNCLAKVPLYTLLVNIYFANDKGLILFYIATITVIAAMLVSRLLTSSVLHHMETAPFVMELPHYHMPSWKSVLRRAFDRTWTYVKKVGTIVVAVATVVYVLLQYPGLNKEQEQEYQAQAEAAIHQFYSKMEGNKYLASVDEQAKLVSLINVYNTWRSEKMTAGDPEKAEAIDALYAEKYPEWFPMMSGRGGGKDAKTASRALKKLDTTRKTLRREMKELRIENSVLGQIGRSLEVVTQFANFDWKVNVALLSSFAARESSVATLGVLFGQDDEENVTLEERMGQERAEQGYNDLTAVGLILFFALYPPCLATVIMIRVQTDSYRWMGFSMIFPTLLGLTVATLVFTVGSWLDLNGVQAFTGVYVISVVMLLILGLRQPKLSESLTQQKVISITQERI